MIRFWDDYHPGEVLMNEWIIPDFAKKLDIPEDKLIEILYGEQPITEYYAVLLSRYFGQNWGFWLDIQKKWDDFQQKRTNKSIKMTKAFKNHINSENHKI